MVEHPPDEKIPTVRQLPGREGFGIGHAAIDVVDLFDEPAVFVPVFLEAVVPVADHDELLGAEVLDGVGEEIIYRIADAVRVAPLHRPGKGGGPFNEFLVLVVDDPDPQGEFVLPLNVQSIFSSRCMA